MDAALGDGAVVLAVGAASPQRREEQQPAIIALSTPKSTRRRHTPDWVIRIITRTSLL
jgi:hypothetical protein